jgi:hypothetical protein
MQVVALGHAFDGVDLLAFDFDREVPSMITVQAPQSPVAQPSLVPESISSSRSTSSSDCWGSVRNSYSSPLTVVVT